MIPLIRLIRLGTIDSTQAYLNRRPELGFCGVMADNQSAGRGRGGNSWESAPGTGLYLSARLPIPILPTGTILQAAMQAVIGTLHDMGVMEGSTTKLGLKWPNDLVAYRESKDGKNLVKIGGIIGEQKSDCVLLGLGLNIFGSPELPERPIPPASLALLGVENLPDIEGLAKQILMAWQNLETYGRPSERAFRWPNVGDQIRWEEGSGICQGWEADGRLAVRTESGPVLLSSGDISGISADS